MSKLTDSLYDLFYDLLPDAEAESLRVRLESDPELAGEYEKVKRSAALFSQSLAVELPEGFVLKRPEPDEEIDEEKKTIAAPPELPEEITSTVSVTKDMLTQSASAQFTPLRTTPERSSPALTPMDSGESPALSASEARTIWNPLSGRFSMKYRRINRFLTACSILLLFVALGGFYRIRQDQSNVLGSFFRVKVAAPSVLARSGQNTLHVDVTDIAGKPSKLPVRISLLNDRGERLLTYKESTDASGQLSLALDSPAEMPDMVIMEVTAGESPSARSVYATLPVVEPLPETQKPLYAEIAGRNRPESFREKKTEDAFARYEELSEDSSEFEPNKLTLKENSVPHAGNTQITFPAPSEVTFNKTRNAAGFPSQRVENMKKADAKDDAFSAPNVGGRGASSGPLAKKMAPGTPMPLQSPIQSPLQSRASVPVHRPDDVDLTPADSMGMGSASSGMGGGPGGSGGMGMLGGMSGSESDEFMPTAGKMESFENRRSGRFPTKQHQPPPSRPATSPIPDTASGQGYASMSDSPFELPESMAESAACVELEDAETAEENEDTFGFLSDEASETPPTPNPEPLANVLLEKRTFETNETISGRIRALKSGTPLIVSLVKDGMPLAQKPVETQKAPVTVEFPENANQTGMMQVSVFDPRFDPPREVASQLVFRAPERFLNIEPMEAEHAPEILKVTDEQGLPVQAEVRISLWQGEPPAPQTIFAPVLINNDTDIENAYARKFAESKPFLMEFRGVLTSVCIFGGLVISCVILVLFFFKMLTGYVPLLVSLSGGTVCLLLAVSLYHNHQLPSLGVLQRTESASHDVTLLKSTSRTNSFAKSEELLEAEVTQIPTSPQSTLLHQWHGATDARGMFILEPHQEESLREEIDSATSEPRSFWIEASDPEGRIGAFELKR